MRVLDKIIEARQDTKTIGFNSVLADEKKQSVGEILKQVMPRTLSNSV